MNDRNKTVDVNRRVAEFIEDSSDEMDVAGALSQSIESCGADVVADVFDGETDAERQWREWYMGRRGRIGDDIPHYRNLGNDTQSFAIGDAFDTLQELCEDLDGTLGKDELAHCIALSHYADLEE